MLSSILSNIITETFDREVGRNQRMNDCPRGMLLTFDSRRPEFNFEDVYVNTELLIFAETNYVGVYTRDFWTPNKLDQSAVTVWECLSYHDSCWREDGVNRFIRHNEDRLIGLGYIQNKDKGWYNLAKIDNELLADLKESRNRNRNI